MKSADAAESSSPLPPSPPAIPPGSMLTSDTPAETISGAQITSPLSSPSPHPPPSRVRLLSAFGAVYLFWGSTYVAIRFAVETLPPFLMAGGRFMIAGAILYAWTRLRGTPAPAPRQWIPATVVGLCLLLGGNGGVVWAQQHGLPSGITALIIGITPFWMVIFGWTGFGTARPAPATLLGLVIGFCGLATLLGPDRLNGGGHPVPLLPAAAVLLATLSWALGSLYSRGARLPASPLLSTAMQMLAGSTALLILGIIAGEPARLHLEAISTESLLAFLWLVIFGSLIGFTAYIYLLRHTTPARASTYAYVNPVIAVILGWAIAGEPLTARIAIAAAIIISSVALITRQTPTPPPRSDSTTS